jgi:hypothetical protein
VSVRNVLRFTGALAIALLAATPAPASLVTYHTIGASQDNGVTPVGTPVVLEFTIDDQTPASFLGSDHSEYLNAVTGGFLRIGASTFPVLPFLIAFWNDSGPPGGDLLDQFFLQSPLDTGPPVPGLGQPELVILVMNTLAPAPTPPLSSVVLDQVLPPASAYGFGGYIRVDFFDGGGLLADITAGPLPGPAPASEPPQPALLLAAALALALVRRASNAGRIRRTPVQAA